MISSPSSHSGAFVPNSKAELKAAINNCANNCNNAGKGGGDANGGADIIEDPEKGLHLMLHKGWLKDSGAWWETFVRKVRECACMRVLCVQACVCVCSSTRYVSVHGRVV